MRAYSILLRWRTIQLRTQLPQLAVAQVLFATGTAIGLAFLIPDLGPRDAAYLATGAFLLNLLIISVIALPSIVTETKVSGALDYMWSLPFPRLTYIATELTVWSLAALPGMVISLIVTSIRFDFDLHVSPLVVPALALILLTGATVGTAIGLRSPSAQTTSLFSNFVIIGVLLFSPVNFPVERLPGWLQGLHGFLPIEPMSNLVRATLVDISAGTTARDLAVLSLWCAAGVGVTLRTVSRRA